MHVLLPLFSIDIFLLPLRQSLPHAFVEFADWSAGFDALFKGLLPVGIEPRFDQAGAHHSSATSATVCAVHQNVSSIVVHGGDRKIGTFVQLGRRCRDAIPSGDRQIRGSAIDGSFGEFNSQVNYTRPSTNRYSGSSREFVS